MRRVTIQMLTCQIQVHRFQHIRVHRDSQWHQRDQDEFQGKPIRLKKSTLKSTIKYNNCIILVEVWHHFFINYTRTDLIKRQLNGARQKFANNTKWPKLLNRYFRSRESLNMGGYKSKKKNKLKSITEGEELTNYGIV